MNRRLRSVAAGVGLMLSGIVLGVRGERWFRPDVRGLDRAWVCSELSRTSRLARESHWCVGWAYAIRQEALSASSEIGLSG